MLSISPHKIRKASKTGEKSLMLVVRCLDPAPTQCADISEAPRRNKSQGLNSFSRNVVLIHLFPQFYTWDGQSEG